MDCRVILYGLFSIAYGFLKVWRGITKHIQFLNTIFLWLFLFCIFYYDFGTQCKALILEVFDPPCLTKMNIIFNQLCRNRKYNYASLYALIGHALHKSKFPFSFRYPKFHLQIFVFTIWFTTIMSFRHHEEILYINRKGSINDRERKNAFPQLLHFDRSLCSFSKY